MEKLKHGFGRKESQKGKNDNEKDWKTEYHWKCVVSGCNALFNGDQLSTNEFTKVYEIVCAASNSDTMRSKKVLQNFENSILKQGMETLRKEIKEKPGPAFLLKMADMWNNFYETILPTLIALFCTVPTKGPSVRELTLMNFRDNVVMKVKIDEALSLNRVSVPKPIKQMLLVTLQAVRDKSENYYRLETLTSQAVGSFLGSTTPCVHSEPKETSKVQSKKLSTVDAEFEELLKHRQQLFNPTPATRLSCLGENEISESLASLLADGFELA